MGLAWTGSLLFVFADRSSYQNGRSSLVDAFATRLSAQPETRSKITRRVLRGVAEDDIGYASTPADPSVVATSKRPAASRGFGSEANSNPAVRQSRRFLYVDWTAVTPLRPQRTAGAALAMLEVRRLVRRAPLMWPDELAALAATEGRIRPAPPPSLVSKVQRFVDADDLSIELATRRFWHRCPLCW